MKSSSSFFGLLLVVLCFASSSCAFQQGSSTTKRSRVRGTVLEMTVLTYQGKKKDFKAGSSLKSAVSTLGVKPKYSCLKGECGSCQITVGGQRMRPCIGKVPPEPRLKSLQEKGLEIK